MAIWQQLILRSLVRIQARRLFCEKKANGAHVVIQDNRRAPISYYPLPRHARTQRRPLSVATPTWRIRSCAVLPV